ncbi:hypothetical protein [Bacillus sp. Marseille-P3800]|uniref:hypothetical protein n=1 Tax=Bacillus sp. Marseille-P3800 TaxID=2014782 RepID=UPI000C087822|nr:hypothetical protein [Bacillus sp. Marseille-P3800]
MDNKLIELQAVLELRKLLNDFENYYRANGAVFFVGEINKQTQEVKFFYKQLLPLELRGIIAELKARDLTNRKSTKTKKSIELKSIAMTTLNKVLRDFLNESALQPVRYVEERPDNIQFNGYQLTSISLNSNEALIGSKFFLHGSVGNTTMPLEHITLRKINLASNQKFICGDKSIEVYTAVTHDGDRTTINFENAITIFYEHNKTKNNFSIEVNSVSNILQLNKVAKVMKLINSTEECSINGVFKFSVPEKINDDDFLDELIKLLEDVTPVLENDFKFHPSEDIGKTDITRLQNDLQFFNDFYIKNDLSRTKFDNQSEASFINFNIGTAKLSLYYAPGDKGKKIGRLYNLFSDEFINNIKASLLIDEEYYPVSPYVALAQETLEKAKNFDLEVVLRSLKSHTMDKEDSTEWLNTLTLKSLSAYDSTKNSNFLELALAISFQLLDYEESVPTRINLMQAYKRQRDLTSDEMNSLFELKRQHPSDSLILFVANVLLGQIIEARYHYGNLSTETQQEYLQYPIYTLFKTLEI